MANLSESKAREEIQRQKLRSLYLLVGEDAFKLDHYAQLLFRVHHPAGADREVLYGDELDPSDLLERVRSPSLWDPEKFLLVRQGERITAKQWELLLPLLAEPLERCVLVIQSAKADARLKFFQALGKAGEHAVMVKLEPADGGEWNLWLQSFLKESQKDMEDSARDLLREWTTGSLSELKHVVERAALYAGAEETILRTHVQAVGLRITPEDIFQFTERLLAGDRAASLTLLENLLRQGEEPLALLGLLSRQYRWLLDILALRAEGKADSAIASAAGIFPGAARSLFPASRRLGGKKVVQSLSLLAEADHQLKSSRQAKNQVLTNLVLGLTD